MNTTTKITVSRSDDFTAVIVDGRMVASVSARWALDWQGHAARFGWDVVDEAGGCWIAVHRSRVVAEATAEHVARRYLPVVA